jgi:ferrous iron transport protein A
MDPRLHGDDRLADFLQDHQTSFSTQKNTMKLRGMKNNERGTIKAITIRGNLGLRLREMGLFPGTTIKIEGRAPLYDPIRLKLHGQVLTLRNNEADHIEMYTQEKKQ